MDITTMIKKFRFIVLFLLYIPLQAQDKDIDCKQGIIKKGVIGIFLTTVLSEIIFACSKPIQSAIFGGRKVNVPSQELVAHIAKSMDIQSKLAVQQGYSGWHWLLGPLFSNYNTLFMDSELIQESNQENMQKLQQCLVNIKYNRDRNILIAAITIPLMMYGILKGSSIVLNKIRSPNSFFEKIKKGVGFISQDFNIASLITLCTIFSFIKIQDYFLAQHV